MRTFLNTARNNGSAVSATRFSDVRWFPGVDRTELLAAYLAGLDNPTNVLDRYRSRCATIDRRVRVELPGETVEGMAEAVDDEGRLVVDGRKITAGDVVHLR